MLLNIFYSFIHNMAPVHSTFNMYYFLNHKHQISNLHWSLFFRKLLLHYINNNTFTATDRNQYIVLKLSAFIQFSLLNLTSWTHAYCFKMRMHSTSHPCSPSRIPTKYSQTFDVWLTVHRSSMWNKKPTRCHLVLYLFLLISCSTCFGPHCAHLLELTT